jgi:hypothetical protein
MCSAFVCIQKRFLHFGLLPQTSKYFLRLCHTLLNCFFREVVVRYVVAGRAACSWYQMNFKVVDMQGWQLDSSVRASLASLTSRKPNSMSSNPSTAKKKKMVFGNSKL